MKDDAKAAGQRWLRDFGFPDPQVDHMDRVVKDLEDQVVRVCSFLHDAELRFFFPQRTVPFHNRMVKEVTGSLRKRGAAIKRVEVLAHGYARWLDLQADKTDSPKRRYDYATRLPGDGPAATI